MKCFAQDVNKHCENRKIKIVYKHYLAALFAKKNLDEIDRWFGILLLACLSRDELPEHVTHALEEACSTDDDNVNIYECADDNLFPDKPTTTLYENSKYYQHFQGMYEQHSKNLDPSIDPETPITNKFFCPQLLHSILKKYMPFLPLFTQIDDVSVPSRFSNAPVENWFGLLKIIF